VVAGPVTTRSDDLASAQFWRHPEQVTEISDRVLLRAIRVAGKRRVIRRDWLLKDPILGDLTILKMANQTNYSVPPSQAVRLNALWTKTGNDWTFAESVAGLWAYWLTLGGPVSVGIGSPVPTIAVLIGRAISGVENKVANFRHLDPRDPRQGLSSVSMTDRHVWSTFYDAAASELRGEALENAFHRFWGDPAAINATASPVDEDRARNAGIADEVAQWAKLSLPALDQRMAAATAAGKPSVPPTRQTVILSFVRDPLVMAYAKVRAGFGCEVPDCRHPTFQSNVGQPYCEVHHIVPLAEGGEDTVGNVACLCPAHHREIHFGKLAIGLRNALAALRNGVPSASAA
jgi:HNH endonuclease